MSRVNWGGMAGGLAAGLEQGQRMRLQREQAGREAERHDSDMLERRRVSDQRAREEGAWEELNAAIARRLQQQTPQPPQVSAPGAAPAQEQPQAEPIDQGNGVQTMPMQDAGAGLERRPLPAEPADTPTAAARPVAQAQAAGPSDSGQKIGFALYQNTNLLRDPAFLNEAAQIFTKARMPQGVQWLERSFKAQQENAIDALKAFAAGNAQRGIELFNASGQRKIEDAQPVTEGPDKGKWMLRMTGIPQPVVMDPGADLKSFLDPKAYFEVINRERDDARAAKKDEAEVDWRRAQANYWNQRGRIEQQNADSLRDYRTETGAAATTRANRPPSTGGGRGGGTPADPTRARNALSAQIDSQLRRQMRDTAPTDAAGKKLPNPLSEFIPDIREQVMQDVDAGVDPNVAFNNRYVEWGERFEQANEVIGQAFDQAKRAGSGILKGRSDAVASLRASIEEIANKGGVSIEEQRRFAKASKRDMALFEEAARGMASGRVAAAPRPGSAPAPAAAQEPPKRPTTRAEVEGYPSGTRYINPADGRILVKK